MCGIIAYIGKKPATTLLLEGLKRLEYRGYDSAGVAVTDAAGKVQVAKSVGRVRVLEELIENRRGFDDTTGSAHTRWARRATSSRARPTPRCWCT